MKLEITVKNDKLQADFERLRVEFQNLITDLEESARAQSDVNEYESKTKAQLVNKVFALEERVLTQETKTALLPLSWAELIKRLEKAESAISDKFTGTYTPNEMSLALKVDNLFKEFALQNRMRDSATHTQARIVDEYRVKIEALETILSSTVGNLGHLQSRIDSLARISTNNSSSINDLVKLIPAPKHPTKKATKPKK